MECEQGKFCDLASGNCIDRTGCGTDIHCLPGSVCNQELGRCEDGCLDDADCKLYNVCDRTGLSSPTALGHCLSGRCGDKTFCAYGDKCVGGACVPETNTDYCRDCDPDPSVDDCGNRRNYCLINSAYDGNPAHGGQNFCGIECDPNGVTDPNTGNVTDSCPNGYQCGGVVLLTQDQCTNDQQCGGGGRRCFLGEGDVRGFCSCVTNDDCTIDKVPPICSKTCGGIGLQQCQVNSDCISNNCAFTACIFPAGQQCSSDAQCQETELCSPQAAGQKVCLTDGTPCTTSAECLCNQGSCFGSGRPCTTSGDCVLTCQDGGCLLGAACAPIQGLLCPDVR
jgi:hypothetical protein